MTKPDEGLHRLEDMLVEEVSTVDRAANKRKFLIVKRGQAMATPGPEVVIDKDGNLISTTIKMRAAWKEEIIKTAADALERLASLVETTKSAIESEDANDFPTEVTDELSTIADAISGITEKLGISKGDPNPDAGGNGKDSDPKPEPEDVAKAHWMTTMQELFDDLRKTIDQAKQAAPKAAPASVPNVGSGTQPDKEAAVPGEQFFAEQFKELTASLSKSIDGLKGSVDDVRSTVTKQADRIADLESSVDSPSSRQPDRSNIDKSDDDEPVKWDRDMAAKKRDI